MGCLFSFLSDDVEFYIDNTKNEWGKMYKIETQEPNGCVKYQYSRIYYIDILKRKRSTSRLNISYDGYDCIHHIIMENGPFKKNQIIRIPKFI